MGPDAASAVSSHGGKSPSQMGFQGVAADARSLWFLVIKLSILSLCHAFVPRSGYERDRERGEIGLDCRAPPTEDGALISIPCFNLESRGMMQRAGGSVKVLPVSRQMHQIVQKQDFLCYPDFFFCTQVHEGMTEKTFLRHGEHKLCAVHHALAVSNKQVQIFVCLQDLR